jgi:hypothetical protein
LGFSLGLTQVAMIRMDEPEQEQRLTANNRATLKVLNVAIKVKCEEYRTAEICSSGCNLRFKA